MRNGKILNKKFLQFLFPTILSGMAMSLNEFVDGILVANLIDSNAMTLVNIASPIMFVFAVVFILLGVGGSTVYAGYLGRYDNKNADKTFTAIMLVTGIFALAALVFGITFAEPLAYIMCKEKTFIPVFTDYARVLLISGVLIIPVQVIICFLPSFGRPGTATVINIIANVVNLCMDYVFIRLCQLGLPGAAYATMSGYFIGFLVIIGLSALKKMRLPFAGLKPEDIKILREAFSIGITPAANQVGYCIKISFSNALAFSLAGMDGNMVFSVCIQTVSMVSIFISGVIDAMIPLASSLYGQRDFTGVGILMKTANKMQFIADLIIFTFLELFPQSILAMYNVPNEAAALATTGIRTFSIMFLFRGFTVIFMYYFPIIGRKTYAFFISLVDGFLGLVPLALILTKINGIDGLWQAYALLSVLLLFSVLIINRIISIRSNGKYSKVLLLEHEEDNIPVFECSVDTRNKVISNLSEDVQKFCLREGVDPKLALFTAVSVEEMSVYTAKQNSYSKIENLDILLKIYPDHILIDFSSIGRPFDTVAAPEEYSNMEVLRKTAQDIEYNYVLGMNRTRIKMC